MKKLTEQDLIDLKGEIDEAKTKVSELNGQKTALMKQLKETWGCDSLEQAEKKLGSLNTQILNIKEKIDKKTTELEEQYFTEE